MAIWALSATLPARRWTSGSDSKVNLCEMQSARRRLVAAAPSAVRPDTATPTLESILKSLRCEALSSEAARLSVARTTNLEFCERKGKWGGSGGGTEGGEGARREGRARGNETNEGEKRRGRAVAIEI